MLCEFRLDVVLNQRKTNMSTKFFSKTSGHANIYGIYIYIFFISILCLKWNFSCPWSKYE